MKSFVTPFAALSLGLLALSGCGKSDKASDAASPDNVEMPAEEAMSGVTGVPSPDASALATEGASDAGSAASDAASGAATAAASGAASAKAGVDAATKAAEKKM